MKIISILIPVYNEKENIMNIYQEIIKSIEQLNEYAFEIIFMDNCSEDLSVNEVKKIIELDKRVKLIIHSRNYGYQANILSGYYSCSGDAAIVIDADGQDDPKYIQKFINAWKNGYKVVYGIRENTADNIFLKYSRKLFYKILKYSSYIKIPLNVGDFRLIDRRIIDDLKKFEENNIFLRATISSIGYSSMGIPYSRRKRELEKSKFDMKGYLSFGIEGILSFSKLPLKIIFIFGLLLFLISLILIVGYFLLFLFGFIEVKGFTSTILLLLFYFGTISLFLGVIALYLSEVFMETKKRPRYIIREKINF